MLSLRSASAYGFCSAGRAVASSFLSSFKSNSLVVALKALPWPQSMTSRVRRPSARLQRFMPWRVIRERARWTRKKVMPNQAPQMNSSRQHQNAYVRTLFRTRAELSRQGRAVRLLSLAA